MQEMQEIQIWSLDWEDPLEEEMATHSSILAWKIPWTEEHGGYNPFDDKESDTTVHTHTHMHTHITRVACNFRIHGHLHAREELLEAKL